MALRSWARRVFIFSRFSLLLLKYALQGVFFLRGDAMLMRVLRGSLVRNKQAGNSGKVSWLLVL